MDGNATVPISSLTRANSPVESHSCMLLIPFLPVFIILPLHSRRFDPIQLPSIHLGGRLVPYRLVQTLVIITRDPSCFFYPIQFHFELTDLLIERRNECFIRFLS